MAASWQLRRKTLTLSVGGRGGVGLAAGGSERAPRAKLSRGVRDVRLSLDPSRTQRCVATVPMMAAFEG